MFNSSFVSGLITGLIGVYLCTTAYNFWHNNSIKRRFINKSNNICYLKHEKDDKCNKNHVSWNFIQNDPPLSCTRILVNPPELEELPKFNIEAPLTWRHYKIGCHVVPEEVNSTPSVQRALSCPDVFQSNVTTVEKSSSQKCSELINQVNQVVPKTNSVEEQEDPNTKEISTTTVMMLAHMKV
jgi:hypothetical protein